MTAAPRSYDLLLHRLVSDFSTELSPAHQPVLHNLSTGLSTGCTYPLRGFAAAKQSRAHQRESLDGERQRSVDSGVRISKTPGCSRWVQGEGQNPHATARLQFFSRERESVNRLTGMIGHFHLPAAARFDLTVHLPDDFAA